MGWLLSRAPLPLSITPSFTFSSPTFFPTSPTTTSTTTSTRPDDDNPSLTTVFRGLPFGDRALKSGTRHGLGRGASVRVTAETTGCFGTSPPSRQTPL
ncbi:hypothetical protein VTJ04DRAFT_7881 [Mycothermus thermophilus]|uniref:uncharacterized protein n=1 Tax=Humicola insolens TaxID=85995 RepID=UPI0037435C17